MNVKENSMRNVFLSTTPDLQNATDVLGTLSPHVHDSAVYDENISILEHLADPLYIRGLLVKIRKNRRLLSKVASRSYRHVNHFDKIVLVGNNDPQGYRLTLHLWAPPYNKQALSDELIHDHRFSFWSQVVAGVLTADNFEEGQDGPLYRKYRYIPEARDRTFKDFYEFCVYTHLRKIAPTQLQYGNRYAVVGPLIHQVILPRNNVTCTLVLRGPRVRSYANVFNTEYPADNTQFDNQMFTADQMATKLETLMSNLY